MNIVDIILIVLIITALIAAGVKCFHNKKQGNGCCGDCTKCGGCSYGNERL